MAMMAILVAAMLGGLMLPMVISQNRSTRFDITRIHSLHAAQAGIDVVLGQVRASTAADSSGYIWGAPARLPCYPQSSPLTGQANSTGSGRYVVSVVYWATTPGGSGSPMICSTGYGTYDLATATATPRYAVITSTGTDGTVDSGSKGRTVISTYVFQTDDTNIPGGQIRLYPLAGSSDKWCMQADKLVPDPGTRIVIRACSSTTPPLAQQVFAYRSDLSIQLVSSVKPATPGGLCIDTEPTAHAAGVGMVLKTCGIVNPGDCVNLSSCSPYNQQWSVDDNAHLRGASTDKSNTDGYCINAASQTEGVPLTLVGCAGSTQDPYQTWVPAPTAGAGMAGAGNNQLVNYRQFATCLDVTGQDPNAAYLILYTCKQNPNPVNVAWNQKFTPVPGLVATPSYVRLLKTTQGSTSYCLTSPMVSGGGVVRVTPCPVSATAGSATSWTIYQTQGDTSGSDLSYAQKFTIVDSQGSCLGSGVGTDLHLGQYLKATVSRCDGSTSQKWNANASLDASRVTNTHETP